MTVLRKCVECNRELELNGYYFKVNPKGLGGFLTKCKECSTKRKVFTSHGLKICSSCQLELDKNADYFMKKRDTFDGFTDKCKKCMGYNYTNKLTMKPKEGYKFCIKCERELKNTPSYFPVDRQCKDGLRSVCRECGKDGHFMDESYSPKKWWANEETELFKQRYPHYLNSELIEIFYPNFTEKKLWDKAYLLGIVKSKETNARRYKLHSEKMWGVDSPLFGITRSESTKIKNSKVMKQRYEENGSWLKGRKKSIDQKHHISMKCIKLNKWVEENNPNWQGGISSKTKKARSSKDYRLWRSKVLERDNYTCQKCGCNARLEAHHLEPFHLNEELRFDVINGLTLCETCHSVRFNGSFHNIYGTSNNTLKQLHEYFKGISWCIYTKREV